jgi:hypothetical protein
VPVPSGPTHRSPCRALLARPARDRSSCVHVRFDLAVWEGERPASDKAALAEYEGLMDMWQGGGPPYAVPTSAIRAYVNALLEHWPDITTEAGTHSPWADGPLMGNAPGPLFYFAMVWKRSDEAGAFAAARTHGLVCFDPQACRLL